MHDSVKRRSILKALGGTGIAAVGSLSAFTGTAAATPGSIPSNYLTVYRETGNNWGIDWAYLAGIGWIESHHGQYEAGCETSSAGAKGPMQFMPSTWDAYGLDGDGDGDADICDYRDAIPSAAYYLTDNGAPEDWDSALYAYNHSWSYVNDVKDAAAYYRNHYAHSTISFQGRNNNGKKSYAFRTTGNINRAGSAETNDSISQLSSGDYTASGQLYNTYEDAFNYAGTLSYFTTPDFFVDIDPGVIRIKGRGSGGKSYGFRATGDVDRMSTAESNDSITNRSDGSCDVEGQLVGENWDEFAFNGQIAFVTTTEFFVDIDR